ncbi:MAG: trypsin-like peptidase domain-containing protein [Verrucomicrobia bacterium]|nr:trypsin-like peptidase domain-containing protein [Verrucomicrobiota bacterium]
MLARSFLALTLCGSVASPASEIPDLRALARQTRPAVYLLVLQDEDGKTIGSGTGFLVSPDGLLVTNHHVIAEARVIIAKAENGGLFPVRKVLVTDIPNDLAILQLEGKDLPCLSLAPPGSVDAGTRIAVIGSPLGLEGTLTEGIVSARRKMPGENREVLQISAPISKGSSGSPVLDSQGRVVGVASFLLLDGQSLNFASPSEKLRPLLARAGKGSLSTTTAQPIPSETPKAGSSSTYVVKSGDTLSRITRDLEKRGLRTTADEIRVINQLPTNSILRPGQILQIPETAKP